VGGSDSATDGYLTLFRDAVDLTPAGCTGITHVTGTSTVLLNAAPMDIIDSPATASEVTYAVYWKAGGGTVYLGRRGVDTNVIVPSVLIVEEVAAA